MTPVREGARSELEQAPAEPSGRQDLACLVTWLASRVVVSLVAGAAASVALGRLATLDGAAASRAVLYLALSPYAVFLIAGRATLLWWPLFVLLALCSARRPWVHAACLAVAAALMALLVLTFTAGRWAG